MEYVIIPTLDDIFFEGFEDFVGSLTTTDSAVRIVAPNATVGITENDGELFIIIICQTSRQNQIDK